MIVLDASAVVEMVLRTDCGERVADEIASSRAGSHAPQLLDAEVASVLRRLQCDHQVSAQTAEASLLAFQLLPIQRHALAMLLPRAWELRKNLTIYDGLYVALAEALHAPLLTADRRLIRAAGSHTEIDWLDA